MTSVRVQIVTFNSAGVIGACLKSLAFQTHPNVSIHVLDNASTDPSIDAIDAAPNRDRLEVVRSGSNLGFAAGHNRLARNCRSTYVLFLNPDTVLAPDFISLLANALEGDSGAGSATGKLLRMDGQTIDSTGIVMTRNQRHLDRGADEPDRGQYDTAGEVFGPSGAAAMYRYQCIADVSIAGSDGMIFDEDFFAYREDADLAWRCRLMGWTSLYVPRAVARHRRLVTPERRSQLSGTINRHSVKNRFLLRINNISAGQYRRDFWRITARDTAVVGYVLLREWSSIPGLWEVARNWKRLLDKRRRIRSRVRVPDSALLHWFG